MVKIFRVTLSYLNMYFKTYNTYLLGYIMSSNLPEKFYTEDTGVGVLLTKCIKNLRQPMGKLNHKIQLHF